CPEGVAVIGGVGGAKAAGRKCSQQCGGNGRIASLLWGCLERQGTAAAIDNSMDLCRPAASRAADRLEVGPPFPPAAERRALAVVLSIIWNPLSSGSTSAANRRRQM